MICRTSKAQPGAPARTVVSFLALIASVACTAQAEPPAKSVVPSTPPTSDTAARPASRTEPVKAAPPSAEAPTSADSYAELIETLLQRDLLNLDKAVAQERFAKFAELKAVSPRASRAERSGDELELTFTECVRKGQYCVSTAELSVYASSETGSSAIYRSFEERLRKKLGKVQKRTDTDAALASLHWKNGRGVTVMLSERASRREPRSERQVSISIDSPQGP